MRIKPVAIILLLLFAVIACNYPKEEDSTNLKKEAETIIPTKVAYQARDSTIPNAIIASDDPYAMKGLGQKLKHDYICEVHFFDDNYQELEGLKDFKGDYEAVKRITIQRQGITSLPENIQLFNNIELLDLSHNKFEEIDVDKIKHFKKLKSLYLNANKLTKEKINFMRNQLPNVTIFNDEDVNK